MKVQIARFRTGVHFGKGIHRDAVMVNDPTHKWIKGITIDPEKRWLLITTGLDGMHECVMVPMENVTCFVPLRDAQPAPGKSAPAMK